MGSSSSKFRKHLQNGDEVAALNVYSNHSDLRKGLDPNCSYGDNYQHETPLHLAARHGMKSLLRIFLYEHGGNPNKTNGRKETALHCVCMEKHPQYYPVQRRRLECLTMILQWKGAELKDGEIEKVDLAALDEENNTALHYAAQSGLKQCVETLVNHSSPLFTENQDNHTPCDSAEGAGFNDIALYLESKMVFSNDDTGGEIDEAAPEIDSEEYSGLRAQDLQEAKDQLLVETADMLSIPLFTAEALLRNHVACCEKSGVTAPANLFSETPICDICTQTFQQNQEPVHMICHQFCKHCWEGYLNVKIKEGGVHDITCPGYGCNILVPVEFIENVVSRDMARRYLQFDIKAFVDSNPNIKWCPFPGCGRAVRFPEVVEGAQSVTSPRHSQIPADNSRAVDCGSGHHFCWECSGEAHEPCSCDNLQKWHGEISEIKPEKLNGTEQETETAANCLWLVTNSKSCPNCKSPIQKNEGCNHMKCSKRHNSSTGGYFKCNRYEVSKQVEEAETKNTKMQELNKFVHYYTRYKNHENSYKLEEPLLKTAKEKMLKLAEAVNDLATAKDETRFVEEAVHKLLKARRVLKYSYVYGYYLDGPPYRKIVFEFMQTELEECTEILSQMVNRLYLRTPRKKIIEQAQLCHRKRQEFLTAISKGLVPPETPPGLRKKRRKYSMDTEDDFDPENPWIVDASGRHTNIAAILDWPSDDSDEDDDGTPSKPSKALAISDPMPEMCVRECCSRPQAKNPRTGDYHKFCSLRCSRIHKQRKDEEAVPNMSEVHLDERMDILRALEMSRLQYMREQGVLSDEKGQEDNQSTEMGAVGRQEPVYTPAETLDMEIRRLLELSSLLPEPEEKSVDTDDQSNLTDDDKPVQVSRFGENQSTVVSRVPNKSVEDLYHADCSSCQVNAQGNAGLSPLATTRQPHSDDSTGHVTDSTNETDVLTIDDDDLEALGACGGIEETLAKVPFEDENQFMDDFRVEGRILQKMLNMDKIEKSNIDVPQSGGSFGAIKDLSVSNIHVDDGDKMKHFSEKDFSNLSKQSKPKVVERGNGRLFSANTPGDDEKVFTLLSPESDFSESSSSEVWGYRPQLVHDPTQTRTPETDSSIDGCSYADLPNQNYYYKHEDTLSEASPVIVEETKLINLTSDSGQASANQMLLSEMTENLLKMTMDMQKEIDTNVTIETSAQMSEPADSAVDADDVISTNRSEVVVPPSGSNETIRETTENFIELAELPPISGNNTSDCDIIDIESSDAFAEENGNQSATMTTIASEISGNISGEVTHTEARSTEKSPTESRSTFV
ncbi:AKIB1-like protein [Mya arenaria]|uniref:RBR-type E3 ubiquitin transferase n=1 Tax=Mya arenaria TaxID=6604 RepID=A0ABY7ER52_MYAAR|nr:AKIB1-like protein [Mya arenaria]